MNKPGVGPSPTKEKEPDPAEKPLVIVASIPWVRLFLTAWMVALPAIVVALP